jgi:hypothetical protein
MPVRPLIRFPGPEPRAGDATPELLAIYARYEQYAPCGALVSFIENFSEVWLDWIENRQQELLDLIDGLLANLDDAQLGTEIKNFLGDLDEPEWEDHWTSLDAAPAWMKAPILQTARDTAEEGLPLYVDMAVDTGDGEYGVEVTTGFDGEGSWRAINMVHPGPNAN